LELAKDLVRLDELLARSLAIALGVEKVAGIGTPGRMREQGCGRAPPRCGERERDILSASAQISAPASALIASSKRFSCTGAVLGHFPNHQRRLGLTIQKRYLPRREVALFLQRSCFTRSPQCGALRQFPVRDERKIRAAFR